MTYKVELFKPEHHHEITKLGGRCIGGHLDMPWSTLLYMAENPGYTLYHNDSPVACGGFVKIWPGRWQGWALLNTLTPKHMLVITRHAKRILDLAIGRIEISVDKEFAPGHRWAELLGFEVETPLMRAYGPDGKDHVGYVRFNGVK